MYNFDAKKTTKDLIKYIKNWFEINGKNCNAIIGISGGKDSTIVAKLCVEALGKDRVIGVLMPNRKQHDIDISKKVIKYLEITGITINIKNSVYGILDEMENVFDSVSDQTLINLPPRIRMATLYAVSQSLDGRVSNNCNLSEDWVGFSTRYGDSVGDFSPLSNLTVTEVKQIGYELGIPSEFIEKVPSDGLCEKTDEQVFGFSYSILDKYIRTGEIEDNKIKLIIDDMHEKNKFKLRLMDCFEYEGV